MRDPNRWVPAGAVGRVLLVLALAGYPRLQAEDANTAQADELYKNADALEKAGHPEQSIAARSDALRAYQSLSSTGKRQAECCFGIASTLASIRRYSESIERYNQALVLYRHERDGDVGQACTLMGMGSVLRETGDYAGAMQRYDEALSIWNRLPYGEPFRARCHRELAATRREMRDYSGAIQSYNTALEILDGVSPATPVERAKCLTGLGLVLRTVGDFEKAIQQWEQALTIYAKIEGTGRERAFIHSDIAQSLFHLGKTSEGIGRYERAIKIFRGIPGAKLDEALTLHAFGAALVKVDEEDVLLQHAAISRFKDALAIYRELPATEAYQGECLQNLGTALNNAGRPELAIASQEEALALFERSQGNEKAQAACQMEIGRALDELGNLEGAIERYSQAFSTLSILQDTDGWRAACLQNWGGSLIELGKYEEGRRLLEQALAINLVRKDAWREQAGCIGAIGSALKGLGQYEAAIGKFEEALSMVEKHAAGTAVAGVFLGGIGDARLEAGQYSQAIAAFQRARAAMGLRTGVWIYHGLARAYSLRRQPGDDKAALESFEAAAGATEQERESLMGTESRAARFEKWALVFADFAHFIATRNSEEIASASCVAEWSSSHAAEATRYAAAFHYADQGKGRALEAALRERASLRAADPDRSLTTLDRQLSQRISLLTSLREKVPITDKDQRQKLTQGIEHLQQRRNSIEVGRKRQIVGEDASDFRDPFAASRFIPQFRKAEDIARDLGPGTATLQYILGNDEGWLLILTQAGVTAHRLGTATKALPESLPGQEPASALLVDAWKNRADQVGVDGLVQLARMRVDDLSRRPGERLNLVDAVQEKVILERLGAVVLPPTAQVELIRQKISHLLVVPDGSLHYVPFGMLRVAVGEDKRSQYVIERFAVSWVPSIAMLETLRRQRVERERIRKLPRQQILAFANPDFGGVASGPVLPPALTVEDDMATRTSSIQSTYYERGGLRLTSLPETEQEAMRAASLFGSPQQYDRALPGDVPSAAALVFTRASASEDQVKQLLGGTAGQDRFRFLLFSTHGFADPRNGMLSSIALSSPAAGSIEDGYLQAQEIMDLNLDTDLVMLSACQTGLGRMRRGEGITGLSAAFFYAGAESTCASLWQVPSGPTSQLVTELFQRLKEGKLNRAEALREAQLQVMRGGRSPDGTPADYSAPFCWAAFVLSGEYEVNPDKLQPQSLSRSACPTP